MADIGVTPASVLPGADASIQYDRTAGGTVTAGDAVYVASDGHYEPCTTASAVLAKCVGIALNGASDGQPLAVQSSGLITIGGTAIVGEVYCVSDNAGKLAPDAEVLSGDFRTVIATGVTAAVINIQINVSGVAVP